MLEQGGFSMRVHRVAPRNRASTANQDSSLNYGPAPRRANGCALRRWEATEVEPITIFCRQLSQDKQDRINVCHIQQLFSM